MELNIKMVFKKCNTCDKSQNIIYFMQYNQDGVIIINNDCCKCNKIMRIGKVCTKCNLPKLLNEFITHNKSPDGRQSMCRNCYLEYKKQYNKDNSAELVKHTQEYYKLHPEKRCYKGYDPNNYIKYKEYFDNYSKKRNLDKKNNITMNQQMISV